MWEGNMDRVTLTHAPTGNLAQPKRVRDQESNRRPFGLQEDAQPTGPHLSGHSLTFKYVFLEIQMPMGTSPSPGS